MKISTNISGLIQKYNQEDWIECVNKYFKDLYYKIYSNNFSEQFVYLIKSLMTISRKDSLLEQLLKLNEIVLLIEFSEIQSARSASLRLLENPRTVRLTIKEENSSSRIFSADLRQHEKFSLGSCKSNIYIKGINRLKFINKYGLLYVNTSSTAFLEVKVTEIIPGQELILNHEEVIIKGCNENYLEFYNKLNPSNIITIHCTNGPETIPDRNLSGFEIIKKKNWWGIESICDSLIWTSIGVLNPSEKSVFIASGTRLKVKELEYIVWYNWI